MDAKQELEQLRRLDALERKAARAKGAPSGLAQGFLDPVAGAGQLVPRALEQVTSLGGLAPNPVSEAYKRNYEQTMDPYARDRERDYTLRREEAGKTGFDVGRIAGNVLNPINYVGGAGLAPTLARGAMFGASQPITDTEDFAKKKAMQVGAGTVGAYLGKLGGDKLIGPAAQKTKDAALLLKEKIPLTVGQRYGGFTKGVEDKLTSVPILGDLIKGAQSRSVDSMNKAAYGRALSPVGEKMPKDIELGGDAVGYIQGKLGDKYDDLLPKLTGKLDDQFVDDLGNLKSMVGGDDVMNAAEKSKFSKIIGNALESRMTGKAITGQALKDVESELGEKAAKFGAGTVSERQLADALKEAQGALRQSLTRQNPNYAKELSNINKGYANFKVVQKAAASSKKDGVFTPNQLQTAVRMADKSKDKGKFAKGEAIMQDLGGASSRKLPNSIPNSGTVDRALMLSLALSAGAPIAGEYSGQDWLKYGALLAAPSLLYTKTGVGAANLMGNAASKLAPATGQAITKLGAPASSAVFNQR